MCCPKSIYTILWLYFKFVFLHFFCIIWSENSINCISEKKLNFFCLTFKPNEFVYFFLTNCLLWYSLSYFGICRFEFQMDQQSLINNKIFRHDIFYRILFTRSRLPLVACVQLLNIIVWCYWKMAENMIIGLFNEREGVENKGKWKWKCRNGKFKIILATNCFEHSL